MIAFWDTSTILSVVLNDRRSRQAEELLARRELKHTTSPLVALEAENRLRALSFETVVNASDLQRSVVTLERVFASDLISVRNIRETRLIAAEARRMIRHFSASRPHKTMDLIHVACARLMRAEIFITFDANQSGLAEAAGFRVSPP